MHSPFPRDLDLETIPIVLLAILGVVASVGILSNAVILITVWTDQRLRNSTCWFICSLAAADIVVLTCVVPFAAIQDLAGHWPYEDDFCDMWIVFDLTFSVASLLSIFLLAIDKYLTIKFPFTYSERMNTKVVAATLICTWSFAFFTILIPVTFGRHPIARSNATVHDNDGHPTNKGECLAKFTSPYAMTLSLLDFVLPCLVMCMIYAKLYVQARATSDEIKAVRISLEYNYVTSQQDKPKTASITKLRSEFKAAFTIALIMGTYLFCWMPFFFLQILSSIDQDCCTDTYFKVGLWLGYVNSMANPLIYGLMDKKIRAALKMFLWRASITAAPQLPVHKEQAKSDSVSSG